MESYTLNMRDDQCDSDVVFAAENDKAAIEWARDNVDSEAREWVECGEWGDDGASIVIHWKVINDDGDLIDNDSTTVEIEPNENALIPTTECGDTVDSHSWTAEGCGGLDENPGVWSTGGTSMLFVTRCRNCGLERREHHCGSQRNPGEHDTIEFRLSDSK